MPVALTCPACGRKFRVGDEFVGKPVACPACNREAIATGPMVPPFDAFVSYSSKDKAMADAVVATLEADGIRCWVAPRDIVPGKEWSEAIIDGINKSRMVVLIFSANSNASQQVLREVERAVNRAMPIVPFRIENLLPSRGMEYFISASHWLDAYHPPLDDHLRKLSATAQALLTGIEALGEEKPADLKGRLRAAVKALTARDNRVRVLAGLTALVFLIGLLSFAAVYALRPKAADPAPPELVRAKADAEVVAGKVRGLDKGEGISARADEVENHLRSGQTLFGERKFAEAGEHFQAVAALAPQVIDAARARDELRMLREDVNREFNAARANSGKAPAEWAEAERKKQAAEQAYARGDFATAREEWSQTRSRLADLQASVQVIADKKALAFWLGYAGRSLREARRQDAMLAPLAKAMLQPHKPNDVSGFVATLRECKTRLELKPELIDQLLNESDNNVRNAFLLQTLPDALRAAPDLGLEVQRAYWFGNNLAALAWALDTFARVRIHPELPPLPKVAAWFQPVIENGGVAGAPQEMLAELRAAHVAFDKEFAASIGRLNPEFGFVESAVDRLIDIVGKYVATPDAAAKSFVLTLSRPGVPGQEEVIRELRRVRAVVYFDDPKTPKTVTEVYLSAPVSDVGRTLDAVGKLTGLRVLHLGQNTMTDSDLARLRSLSELRTLFVGRTHLTDGGLPHLKGMTKLERLYLNNTAVTDAGLAQLHGLKELRQVDTEETQVTMEGAKALQLALPKVRVVPFDTTIDEERINEFFKKSGNGPVSELVKPKTEPKRPRVTKADPTPSLKPPKEIATIPTKFEQIEHFHVNLDIAADGKRVAAGGFENGTFVHVWESATRKKLASWDQDLSGVPPRFAPDGRLLLDDLSRVFDIAAGKTHKLGGELADLEIKSHVVAPDGKTIALGCFSGKNAETKVLRLAKLPELTESAAFLELFDSHLLALAYSPDGTQLAAYVHDRAGHKVLRLDPKTGAVKATLETAAHDQPRDPDSTWHTGVAFSPDGKLLGAYGKLGFEHRITWWDLATGKPRKSLVTQNCEQLAFMAGGRMLAAIHDKPADPNQPGDPEGWAAYVYDTATGELRGWAEYPPRGSDPKVLCGARGLFISGRETGEVIISDLANNRLGVKFKAHAGPVLAIAISPDGKHLATFGAENKVKVWSLE